MLRRTVNNPLEVHDASVEIVRRLIQTAAKTRRSCSLNHPVPVVDKRFCHLLTIFPGDGFNSFTVRAQGLACLSYRNTSSPHDGPYCDSTETRIPGSGRDWRSPIFAEVSVSAQHNFRDRPKRSVAIVSSALTRQAARHPNEGSKLHVLISADNQKTSGWRPPAVGQSIQWLGAPWRAGGSGPRILATYALAGGAGYLATLIDLPLPWMLGPFFACGAVSALGIRLAFLPMGRELGQVAIGLAVGMRFTPAILAAMVALLPAMLAATAYVVAFTVVAALIFARLAAVDRTTAFFATAAGGVADMAVVAQQQGGNPNAVAIVHALRVSGVVSLVPILAVMFGSAGHASPHIEDMTRSLPLLVVTLVAGYGVARLLKPTPLPNPWLVGPIFLGLILSSGGVLSLEVPDVLIVVAQIAIGTWLGCQFKREIIVTLPRVAAAGAAIAVFMIAAAAVGAFVLQAVTDLPYTTGFLALAPAAVTEMVLTAQYMQLDAELVTAFHIMRIAVVSSTILPVFKLYMRLQGGCDGSRS